MAYDVELANRLREQVGDEKGLTEKAMFGGLAFLINGNMAVSASGQGGLLLRVDPAETEALIQQPHAARFVMRGRETDGWLRIDPAGITTDDELRRWTDIGVAYARSLPPK
ncbi:MAG TPA: TfoX/Sxy family protein [Jatrophihabitantaceae bacterium]